ncbi:unnamed protein product [Prunus armeniaca]
MTEAEGILPQGLVFILSNHESLLQAVKGVDSSRVQLTELVQSDTTKGGGKKEAAFLTETRAP